MNAIQCTHCGCVVQSKHRHDFAAHTCAAMQAASGPDAMIAADGGEAYLRRIGNTADYREVDPSADKE